MSERRDLIVRPDAVFEPVNGPPRHSNWFVRMCRALNAEHYGPDSWAVAEGADSLRDEDADAIASLADVCTSLLAVLIEQEGGG